MPRHSLLHALLLTCHVLYQYQSRNGNSMGNSRRYSGKVYSIVRAPSFVQFTQTYQGRASTAVETGVRTAPSSLASIGVL